MGNETLKGVRLSPQQRRVWLLQQEDAVYNAACALWLEGELRVERLREALGSVAARHQILRTNFRRRPGAKLPIQVVAEEGGVSWHEFDWSDRDATRRRAGVAEQFRAQLAEPFDLEDGRTFSATLLKCSPREHALILRLPALCADERTLDNLAREIAEAYGAAAGDAEAADGPVQYAQFAKWQNAMNEDEDGAAGRDYWQKHLPHDSEPPLPFERRWAAETAFRPASLLTAVDPRVAARLTGIAGRRETSTEALLLTCWGALLWRHTGEPELVVRAAFDGRGYEELETACGLFAKHIPVASRLRDGLPFDAALAQTAELLAEAAEWQEFYSWELEAGALETPAPPSARGLGFDYRRRPAEISAAGLAVSTLAQAAYGERFKLRLSCVEQGDELLTEFHYDESLFDAGDIRRLAERFHELLSSVAREPGAHADRLNMLGEAERRELLDDFNRTAADYPSDACVHQLFEAQARRTPRRVAVAHEGDELTYAELNARANRLARHLRQRGVGPETTVGLLTERSADALVALLGILKAGGAYVPLDPSYPRERVAGMLRRGVVKLLLTRQHLADELPLTGVPVLALDAEWPRIAEQSAEDLPNLTAADNLAYVIHTSGSTGRPKGVCVEHRQLLNYLHGVRERLQLDEGSGYATVTTLAADLGYTAVFPSLCGGGTLHILSQERASDADALAAYFEAHPVDCLKIVPSHLAALLNAATRPELILPRRRLVVGGEASHWDLVEKVAEYAPDCRVLNHYGPTETTVGVLTYEAGEARDRRGATVPLGRPLGNSRVYVLDADMRPSPVGMTGEIYIGGAGVARGYLQQPALSAERFIPDPFSAAPGARLYRAGDLGRHLSDGNVEFLGRADDQVKVRGYRIEPGEIEAALKEHPSVREAVVAARDDGQQQKSLVAYVVARGDGDEAAGGARLHTLPNDLSVFHLNRNEADHLYREIFEDRLYLRHGVTLRDGDCVFDVGANIGLFTLFAEQQCRDLSVYAFEPNPAAFDKLRRNVERYGLSANLFERGVSNRVASATYTFYPQASVMSGFYPDLEEEKRLFKSFMLNQQLEGGDAEKALLSEYADELTDGRFESHAFECRLTTISDFIREHGVGRIDLLKVDVEKSEVDVLEGIAEEDWPKIRQVVVEVHDLGGRVENVLRLLTGHGFSVEQDELVEGTGVYNIFARRAGAGSDGGGGRGATRRSLQVVNDFSLTGGALRAYLLRTLPEYMLPAGFVLLERLPRTPNGKIDRRALPAPEHTRAELAGAYVAPRTPTEEIVAGIWAQVLKAERVGVNDNFFELGGHSLLATQVISRIRQVFQVEVGLRSLFDDATVSGLSSAVELAQAAGRGIEAPPLRPAGRDGELPLSFAQQRLWFIDQMEPDSPLYNLPVALRLGGPLDVKALERTLSEVARRHEILRTSFPIVGEEPVQRIAPFEPLTLEVEDLREAAEGEREAEVLRRVREEAGRPFNLARGPLVRVNLLRLAEDDHVVLLTMHHIVSDGWSAGVLVDEVVALYGAFTRGEESPLAELPVQYADYAAWQRGWLAGDVLESHLKYWHEKLGGGVPVLELPTDFARPAAPRHRGRIHSTSIPADVAEGLRGLSRREGVTMFMTLLAGWQALLSRYTGQEDIAVGTPVAGRNHAEVEGLIGFFVNTLVLRTDLSGDPSFTELLRRVREVSLGAYAHQEVPFEKLVEELAPERDLSRSPLFQVAFVLQNAPVGALELPGLTLRNVGADNETAKFELTLSLAETHEGLSASLQYDTDLFEQTTAERILTHFAMLLRDAAADPRRRLSELSLMGEEERRRVVREWNDTATPFPADLCVHELFERQAAATPDAVAVSYGDERLTYAELNERANRLGRYLRAAGVGPDTLVGLSVERSSLMVVGMLGILKAGGAYLPLDPSYPMGRLTFMLEDAGVGVLLTQGSILGGLPEAARAALPDAMRVLCLDTQWGEVARHEADDFEAGAGAGNLAYVIYTSGSTGTPKGVMITHGAICNHMRWMLEEFSFTPEDSVLQKTPAGFDASVWEFYAPLLSGGRLVVARPGAQADHAYLLDAVRGERVTTLQVVPAMLRLLVGEREAREAGAGSGGGLAGCGSLRRVFCGGEALPRDVAERFAGEARGARLYNLYGPTEATIDALWCECTAERVAGGVPLGRAVANTRVYVLDGRMRAAPAGVAGELYLGGAGLARGYLNRPALTAERFVPDPFSGESGARLYRTGDVGRHLAGGEVDFLGRADHQVKIRGYRIELGEVEAAVRDAAWVRDCAVVAREEGEGDRRLVAYVVAEGGREVDTAGLREGLSRRLPGYMVPSHFVMLEALPLTPNGKLDRKALPAPGQTRDGLGGEYMAPRTPAEEMMANIWAGVLKVAQVGVQDNFFALGGHSLLATQVISRVRSAFGVEPPLRTIFERPTVAGLTGVVEELMRGGGASPQPPLVRAERSGELPVSFAQQRLWFLDRLIPGSPVYNMPLAVRLSGRLDVGALSRTLSEVVRRHEALRTTFGERDGEPVQVIHEPEPLNLEVEDLSMLDSEGAEAEAVRLLTEESRTPFDLAAGPLLRARLLRLSEDDHVALLTMHHIVSDGWSIGVFIDEVAALYSAYAEGKESPLPELEVQYADYAAWQRDWLQGEALESHLKYWREKLGGGVPALEVPTDFARPAVAGSEGASVLARMGAAAAGRLRELSRREGVTMFMTLLAGWQALLSRYTGQEDIAVGTPVAGRNRAEVEGLIGFFVNTLVLRTDLSGDPSFTELLGRVREVSLGAYAHQDVPYEKLVEEFQPERDLSRDGLFQAMLVLQNAPGGELLLPGLKLSPAGAASETAKFELTLTAAEAGDDLLLSLNYRTELFTGEMAGRMLEHLVRLLEGAGADPGLRVGELELMSEAERRQVIFEWNDTAEPFSSHLCLHEFFERQVSRTPDAVALSFEGRHLSYAELDARANRLARHLRGLGVGPEVLVGVMMRRSTEMVVALMGILKAGGAYVPIDLAYPPERVAFMLEDSGARVLLTESALAHSLAGVMARAVHLDVEAEVIAGRSAEPVESGAGAENLAYVIYTSGSTGTPKGVAIRHRAAAALLCWARSHFGADSLACVLASTSISFDLSVFELFVTLGCGGRVALAHDALGLPAVAASEAVTLVNTVPSAMAELVRAGGLPGSVRVVNLAGEPLARQLVEEVYGGGGVEQVWNLYGPSEDTTYSTFALARVGAARGPSIGRAVANTRVYVLDGRMRAAPAGVAGELYLGGAGLARGYLNRPALTAERFVPDPFSGEPGARLYRTGDVGRHLAGGEVDFLGRADDQVKIRGYRIELGEVEAAVRDAAWVRDCAVVAREEGEGDRRLVAYVVAEGGREVDTSQLRESLGARLPGYMVPSHFVMLEALPLTPNGKVDRKALPAPGQTRDGLGGEYVAPRTSTEEIVAGIWARVLKVAQVGMEDNFFALGGHSLLATQVISRVRSAFGVEPPLRSIFERPTVAGLTGVVEELMRGGGASPQPPLVRAERSGELPVSFAQQRLWFLDRLIPGSSVYNMPLAVRLSGRLDVGALSRTLSEVVRRHEALRTTFGERDGHPVQVVHEHEALRIEVEDLGGCAEPEAEARRLAAAESRTPFDLAAGPLLRTRLLRLSDEEHVVLLTMHHIVSDGWSIGVFIDEVAALYSAYAEGKESPLPELEVQYADYAAWQRGWLQGEALERQLEYWRGRLGGVPALEVPTDFARPAVAGSEGASVSARLGAEAAGRLRELSRREGVTMFMTLLAGWQALLSRYTGQEDIAVGTPVAGRNRAEVEGLIGFFVNTLVLRTDLSGDPTFRELLGRVREVSLGAYAHQDVPYEKLVEEVSGERDLSRGALFQAMLVLQNAPGGELLLPGLKLSPAGAAGETAKFELTLTAAESDDGLSLSLNYRTELFTGETAGRMLRHLVRVLEGAGADAGRRLSELELMSEDERREMVEGWNRTRAEFERGRCVHELFEAQAARTPDAAAVEFGGETLTYGELNASANRVAHRLREMGVGPEARVAVLLERSAELVVALLGVMKAGAAYVPLDPASPARRHASVVEDARAEVVVTREEFLGVLPHAAVALCLDRDRGQIEACGARDPEPATAPDNLAYVIYTSGSTGTPKGVMVQHRSVLNLWAALRAAVPAYGGERLRVSLNAPVTFDASVKQIVQLLSGHTLCVVPEGVRRDAAALREYVARERVDVLDCTPAQLRLLLEGGWAAGRPRAVLAGGEALDEGLWGRMRGDAATVYVNLYGPTECTVDATACVARGGAVRPSIGRPLANTRVYIVDGRLRPAPAGVTGELLVGGEGVARGYLGRPGLTAERFVPDPFSGEAGARLYRTGDLGRYMAGGEIDFIGRTDHQVKVRGYRIELGEVEAAVLGHEGVRDCAVVAREEGEGDRRLVAYVVAEGGREVNTSQLRESLGARLPGYMVPSRFVMLEALPLTPNGKVDRKALPVPGREHDAGDGSPVAPRDTVELSLANIWRELLLLENVGVTDNFFALGGHSLTAVRMMTRIRSSLGVELPLMALFQRPTIEKLAELIRDRGELPAQSSLVALQPDGEDTPFFCVHPIGGHVMCYWELARHMGADRPFYGLQTQDPPAGDSYATIEEMAARYVEAVREVRPEGPYLLGGWSMGGVVAYEMACQLLAQGQQVEMLALVDSRLPADGERDWVDDEVAVLSNFAYDLGLTLDGLNLTREEVGRLPEEARLSLVLEECKRAGVLPRDVELPQVARLLRIFKANARALQSYRPRPSDCPITLLAAEERLSPGRDVSAGWGTLSERVEVYHVPGNHYTVVREPHVRALAENLSARLEHPAQVV